MPPDIREVRFDGTPRQRGRRRGKRLRNTLTIPETGDINDRFVDACVERVRRAYPPALEEFEGILETSGFGRRRFRAYHFARTESRVGCTMFGVPAGLTPPGTDAVVGHNYDWATADLKWCELHRYHNPEARDRLAYTHHWAGLADVLNDAGLYVGISSLPAAPVRSPGVQWNLAVDMVSERCSTVSGAAEALASIRHLRPMSYLLADAGGNVGIVEALPKRVRFRTAKWAPVAAANLRRAGKLLADHSGDGPPGPPENPVDHDVDSERRSARRVERVLELLADNQADQGAAEDVLSDHSAPICRHREPDWGTIWSAVCLPDEGRLCIAPGPPCRHTYRDYRL